MTTEDVSRFRVTHWPGSAVPVPRATRFPASTGCDGVIALDDSAYSVPIGAGAPPAVDLQVDLPAELYVRRFMRLDTTSESAVAAFVTDYGAFETPWREIIPPQWLEVSPWDEWWGRHVVSEFPELAGIERAEAMIAEQLNFGSFLVGSFMLKAGLLRDAVRTWLYDRGMLSWDDVKSSWESDWAYKPHTPELTMRDYFVPVVNRAMAPFTVSLQLPDGLAQPREYSTYNLLALQLANDVAKKSEYHMCERPHCGEVFIFQDGRAKFGQGRARGSKYCSTACGSIVTSSRYRQRRRKQTAAEDEGR